MKRVVLNCLVAVLMMSGFATAATVWNPSPVDPNFPDLAANWNVPENWTQGVPTLSGDPNKAVFNVPGAVECQVTDDAYCLFFVNADNNLGGVLRVMDGGSITTGDNWSGTGYNNNGAHLIVEKGGSVHFGGHMWVGMLDKETPVEGGVTGVVDINGGYIRVEGMFGCAFNEAYTTTRGLVNIDDGGILDLSNIKADQSIRNDSRIDIGFGTLVIDGDHDTKMEDFIAAGKVTGFAELADYGGQTIPTSIYDSGTTIVTAPDPMNRVPEYGAWVVEGDLTLSWTNLTPVAPETQVWVDVWFGTNPETDWNKVSSGSVDESSASVTTVQGQYYWQVDSYLYGNPAQVAYDLNEDDPNKLPVVRGTRMVFDSAKGPTCAGDADFNCNGIVALDDFSYMAGVWLTDDATADIAQPPNETVDIEDLKALTEQWLSVSDEVAYWKFDETAGTVAPDESVNGFDGTLVNMDDSDWVDGVKGSALDFDGVDDFVEITGYQGVLGARARTCAAWIKTSEVSSEILTWGSLVSKGGLWVVRVNEGGQLRADVKGGNIIGTTAINDNTWHHIAVVLEDDGSPDIDEAKLYVDGQLETISGAVDEPVYTEFGENVQIGVYSPLQRPFQGRIDDVRIFDRALSESEIQLLAQ